MRKRRRVNEAVGDEKGKDRRGYAMKITRLELKKEKKGIRGK